MVAMLNMDMVGRGDEKESLVIGVKQNKDLGKVLKAAQKLERTGIKKAITNKGAEIWQRCTNWLIAVLPMMTLWKHLPGMTVQL